MLVLATPYTSIRDMAKRMIPFLPMSLLIGDAYDSLSKAPGLQLPTLVYHGDSDELIPHRMGETMARAIPGAQLVTVQGGHHNDLFARDGERILDEIARIGATP